MDDETKAYLDGMMGQINDSFDRVLDRLEAIRQDADTTRGQLLFAMQQDLTLSQRITKLEEEMRRRLP